LAYAFALSVQAQNVTEVSGTIDSNQTWSLANSPYEVTSSIEVAAGVTLLVESGVEIRMRRYTNFAVNGNLVANGTADATIIWRGTTEIPNWWQGIQLNDGSNGSFIHSRIENAGYGSQSAIEKLGDGNLTIQNSVLANNSGIGLWVHTATAAFSSSANQFLNNATGVRLSIGASFDDDESTFLDNNLDVQLDAGNIANEVLLNIHPDYSIYCAGSITVQPSGILNILPATTLKMARYSRLVVDGELKALGSSTEPIYYTHWLDDTAGGDANRDGSNSSPGANWWQGIAVRDNGNASLDHCHIRYGGYSSSPVLSKTGAGILTFNNGSCSFGFKDGLRLTDLSETAEITNSSFNQNGGNGIRVSNAPCIVSGNFFFTVDLQGNLTVDSGVELTVDPGVVVRVARYALFTINGTLTSIGESENPVEFIGSQGSSNWWQGIKINDTASADFQFSRVAHAGYSSGAAILLNGSDGSVNLENNVIENNYGDGIRISGTYASFSSANNIFRNNGRGANILIGATLDDTTSVFEGNGSDIQLAGGTITRDTTWNVSPGLSLLLAGSVTVNSDTTLTIGPGTTIKVPRYSILTINGTLNCPGEAGAPIHFTHPSDDTVGGDSNQNGDQTGPATNWWQGIYVTSGASADLRHTTLKYGGYASFPGLRFVGAGALNVEDCVFSDCFSHGIYLEGDAESNVVINNTISQFNGQSGLRWVSGPVEVDQCQFLNNGNYGAWLNAGLAFDFSKNQFSGNASYSLGVQPGNITSDTLWTRGQGASFTAVMLGSLNVKPEASWTIHPGISCYFARYSKLTIEGGLVAQGNQEAPIQFMGSTPNPSWWQGISVTGSGSCSMTYCEISNSGYASQSGLAVTGAGSLNLEYSRLHHNSGNGLSIHDHSGPSNIAHSLFESNGTGVRVTSNTNQPVALTLCGIYDNNVGVNNTGTDNVDARSCWWGDASGPQHPDLNPDGTGNSVSDKVLFAPWKIDASLIHPWISVTEVVLYLIALAESRVELSWSDQFPEAQLQSSSDFLIWETVNEAPTLSDGRYRVTLDQIEEGTMAFRIHP
jgi:parallel beta-helix repeat protein